MRSKVHFKSHPLHPVLIAFPIAFFTGTLLFHIAGWILNKPGLLTTAYYLNIAGIGLGLLAAVPGLIDFIYTVPPKSSAKKRAAQHGIINVTMLLIFTAAFFYRRNAEADHYILLLFEIAGASLLAVAGWLGGTLVYRNQIGIDHRYAHAGKWKEQYFDQQYGTITVATSDELQVNAMKLLHFKNKRIVLARTEQCYTAFEDRCTHRGGSLADGSLTCNTVQCPWHGSQFDVTTGTLKAGPAAEGIHIYEVKETGGKVMIVLQNTH